MKIAKFNIILNNLVKKINQEQPKYFFKVVLILTGFIIINTKQEMNFSIQLLSTITRHTSHSRTLIENIFSRCQESYKEVLESCINISSGHVRNILWNWQACLIKNSKLKNDKNNNEKIASSLN